MTVITLSGIIARKDPRLPRFIVIPASAVAAWNLSETTTVDLALNGISLGRKSLKRWDDQRWFVDIPQTICTAAKVDSGSRVSLQLSIADTSLPAELQDLIDTDDNARVAWLRLTSAQQRMLRENVAAAKQSATRRRRARRELKR